MPQKLFLSESNKAILACNICNRQKVVDMTRYLAKGGVSMFKVNCTCGNSWTLFIEKRRYARKTTNLPGDFFIFRDNRAVDNGHMLVVNMSQKGLGLKLNRTKDIAVDDTLKVEFYLDNKEHTFIKRTVQVRNMKFPFVGTMFEKIDRLDPDIGFYLKGGKIKSW